MIKEWQNYGDVNYMIHGGCLIKPHWSKEVLEHNPSLKSEYDVIYFDSNQTTEDGLLIYLCVVDVNDYWIDYEALRNFSGIDENCSSEEKVRELIYYYGVDNFQPLTPEGIKNNKDLYSRASYKEVLNWLIALGVDTNILGEK